MQGLLPPAMAAAFPLAPISHSDNQVLSKEEQDNYLSHLQRTLPPAGQPWVSWFIKFYELRGGRTYGEPDDVTLKRRVLIVNCCDGKTAQPQPGVSSNVHRYWSMVVRYSRAHALCRDKILSVEFAAREHSLTVRKPTEERVESDLYAIVSALESLRRGQKTQLPHNVEVIHGPESDRLRRELEKLQNLSLRALVKDLLAGFKVRGMRSQPKPNQILHRILFATTLNAVPVFCSAL